MKQAQKLILKIAENVAKRTLTHSANSTTCFTIYQPRPPKNLEQFKNKNL